MWKNFEFWEELIKCFLKIILDSINEEMLNQQNYNIYSFENPAEKQKRIQNIVHGQLISFIYNLLSFDISKERVKELVEKFVDYYQLSEDQLKNLFKNIEEYMTIVESTMKADKDEIITRPKVVNDIEIVYINFKQGC